MSNDDAFSGWQMKAMLAVIGLFLMSLYFSVTEMRFWISGTNAEVEIHDIYKTSSTSRRNRQPLIGTRFYLPPVQDGIPLEAALEFPDSWSPPEGRKMWVTYIPGSSPVKVRPRGEQNLIWPLIFFGMVGAVGFMGWKVWQEVSADTEKDRRSRKH
ncbi:MAG: hypothetical protein H0W78_07640 [Planctomycetes bacterium]|jgi:hypothetical protein|nr:hypothetical protein [Planctomycetota bacterium]